MTEFEQTISREDVKNSLQKLLDREKKDANWLTALLGNLDIAAELKYIVDVDFLSQLDSARRDWVNHTLSDSRDQNAFDDEEVDRLARTQSAFYGSDKSLDAVREAFYGVGQVVDKNSGNHLDEVLSTEDILKAQGLINRALSILDTNKQ